MMDGCLALLAREVERYGGRVNAFTGDGVMALFGAPLAEEDHAIRALHAALAIQEHLPRYSEDVQRRFGAEFRMRIGVNSGLVLAGGMGEGTSVEYTALGDTINMAARLESAATPGGVLAGESTYRAAGEAFRWQAVGPLTLKGNSDVSLPTSHRRKRGAEPVRALARGASPVFVGRQRSSRAAPPCERAAAVTARSSLLSARRLARAGFCTSSRPRWPSGSAALRGSCFTYGSHLLLPSWRSCGMCRDRPTVPREASALLDGHLARRRSAPS